MNDQKLKLQKITGKAKKNIPRAQEHLLFFVETLHLQSFFYPQSVSIHDPAEDRGYADYNSGIEHHGFPLTAYVSPDHFSILNAWLQLF
jgi:hypothetical protein